MALRTVLLKQQKDKLIQAYLACADSCGVLGRETWAAQSTHLDSCGRQVIEGSECERQARGVGAAALVHMAVVVAHAGEQAHGPAAHLQACAAVLHAGVDMCQHLLRSVIEAEYVYQDFLQTCTEGGPSCPAYHCLTPPQLAFWHFPLLTCTSL